MALTSRNYQHSNDYFDNGLERAFKQVYAVSEGNAVHVGLGGRLKHKNSMKPFKAGQMPKEK